MRVMVIVKANERVRGGRDAHREELDAMGKFNEELVKAGVMLAGEGLHPSSKGVRVTFAAAARPSVIDGPFAETKELIAGFWIWQVRSLDEAVEWVRARPVRRRATTIEIRPVFEAEDFGEEFTPELREPRSGCARRSSDAAGR